MDLQWTQTPSQIIIKDVPLPCDVQDIEIKLTNATIRIVDNLGNSVLQGITCGNIKDGSYQQIHPGCIDIYLVKEDSKLWTSLFREEVDPGVYISEVVAIGNYTAEEPIEITIRKGDIILVISKDETGWWKGKCNGKIGFFPSNFVRELPATPQSTPPAPKKATQPGVQPVLPSPTKSSSPSTPHRQTISTGRSPQTSQTNNSQTAPTPQPAALKSSALSSNFKRPPSHSEAVRRAGPKIPISETLRPRRNTNISSDKPKQNLVEIIGICKTRFEYKAADPNELSFVPNEYIYIIEKDSSGWWKGESSVNIIGWFSSAYVEELDEETARQIFELNSLAELEESPPPVQRNRTVSASIRNNIKRTESSPSGSPKEARNSAVQTNNPPPSITNETAPAPPNIVAVEPIVDQKPGNQQPAKTEAKPTVTGVAPSVGQRNSGGFISVANNAGKTSQTPAPAVKTRPMSGSNFAAITAAMQEVYNSVKAMQSSSTWQKCSSDPYLGMQDPNKFSAAFCSITGETFSIGDSTVNFPLADIAWPLLFLLMREKMPAKVAQAFKAKEPTAYVVGLPDRTLQNPFYFPGAYTMCSWLTEMPGVKYPWDRISTVLNYVSNLIQGYDVNNSNQFVSASSNNMQLQCCMADYLSIRYCFGKVVTMGTFLKEQNIVTTSVDVKELADIFNQVHSIEANTNILALMAANLANNGTHILTKNNIVQAQDIKDTLSFMDSCGLNNDSKDWQATVGLPAKSSQAGVIMAVIPNVGGIVVYSPPLNVFGNSARGTEFFKQLVQKLPELKK